MMLAVWTFPITDGYFLDVAILTEEFGFSQCLEQFVFSDSGCKTGDINQVLLDDTDTNEVFAILLFGLAFLYLFLSLFLRSFLLVFLNVGAKLGNSDLCVSLGPCFIKRWKEGFPSTTIIKGMVSVLTLPE
jgi:hypothetical protein